MAFAMDWPGGLDLARGMEVYLNFLPGAAMQALREGLRNDLGVGPPLTGMITRQALQAGPLLLTGTSDWVYAIVPLDLFRDGPVVVEAVIIGDGVNRLSLFSILLRARWERSGFLIFPLFVVFVAAEAGHSPTDGFYVVR